MSLHTRIRTLKEWGREVLSKRAAAPEGEVLEVLSFAVALHKEVMQGESPLTSYYMQTLAELEPLVGTLLILGEEQAESCSPEGLPWNIHSSEIYERGISPWSKTLGIPPVVLWYSFQNPGEPPEDLLLPDGSWNSGASRDLLLKSIG
jgi:hypothetical protein